MQSILARLIVRTTIVTMVIYVIAASGLYVAIRRSLLAEFDATLAADALAISNLTDQTNEGIKLDFEPGEMAEFNAAQRENGFILRALDGKALVQSGVLGDNNFSSVPIGRTEFYGFAPAPGAQRQRFLALRFVPRVEEGEHLSPGVLRPTLVLVVARSARNFDRRLNQLLTLLSGVFGLTALSSAATMAWVIKRGLLPLRALATDIHATGIDDLSRRIILRDCPAEIRPVVERLNELLARLEGSFDRERSFTADVAHELRTPLAGLIAALEVCGSQPRPAEEYARVVGKCLNVSRDMHGMVENLLTLARADASQLTLARDRFDLGRLLLRTWKPFELSAKDRKLHISWYCDGETPVTADKGMLALVLRNLFDNAVTYANAGGSIGIEARNDLDCTIVCITNSGCEIAAADATKVFDRFWRGDAARNAIGQHCGLGLALCQRIISLIGGSIDVETALGGTFKATIRIPAQVVSLNPFGKGHSDLDARQIISAHL